MLDTLDLWRNEASNKIREPVRNGVKVKFYRERNK